MLAELAAANAAFAVIKQAVSNGKEIAAAGNAIAEFVGAKEKLEKKASKKGNGSDLEEFMALEQIREKEKQLKELMIYLGRPGLWGDWQKFQAKARVARREAENAAVRRRKKIIEGTIIAVLILAIVGVLAALVVLILHAQGRL
jgi:hypothetical protein|tara:strand:- start:834 stop:1265 length:432 start_codon:yes stop_codon:yes gene_type:complete